MKRNGLRKMLTGSAMALALVIASGALLGTTASADERDRGRDFRGERDWRGNGDRGWRGGRDDRYRGGYVYTVPVPRPYGYYGPYAGSSFVYGTLEARGYRDGLNRGIEDARSGRYGDPNNSEHFRDGGPAYRAGFARGYNVGYGEYGRR